MIVHKKENFFLKLLFLTIIIIDSSESLSCNDLYIISDIFNSKCNMELNENIYFNKYLSFNDFLNKNNLIFKLTKYDESLLTDKESFGFKIFLTNNSWIILIFFASIFIGFFLLFFHLKKKYILFNNSIIEKINFYKILFIIIIILSLALFSFLIVCIIFL